MLLNVVIFLGGLGTLYLGAEWLVQGAASLALRYGIRPMIVGITVVALGTSMPEFVVNFFAALSGEDSIALGNIVGSNIANIAMILGVSAMVVPLAVRRSTLKKEYPLMLGVMVVFYLLAIDGRISNTDGFILIGGLFGFFVFLVVDARRHAARAVVRDGAAPTTLEEDALETFGEEAAAETDVTVAIEADDDGKPFSKSIALIGGIIFLAVGARLMVYAAVNVADMFGIDPVVIGLTIVAIGTSLPELAASIVSTMRNENDLSIGNILGSNLLNVLFVVGLVSSIRPLNVQQEAIDIHFPVMLAFCVLLFPLAWTSRRINRVEGAVLFLGFLAYVTYLTVPYL